jgi:hypothetical protein
MRRGKTRKNVNKYNMINGNMFGGGMLGGGMLGGGMLGGSMFGGAPSPANYPPYVSGAMHREVLQKLTDFAAEVNALSKIADDYKTTTDNLNNSTLMETHMTKAGQVKARAQIAYDKAKEFWQSVYGTTWNPPPEPAPAPSPSV